MSRILNINIGCLGHIDSGKTSLAKALSTTASTSCFDKSRESRERGITIDLGFSCFTTQMPQHLKHENSLYANTELMQFTFVDCPGHSSLIRTIIGGSQIIDFLLLVIDITKGFQTQTAECLVIGEITCDKMIVVLNKIDLIESNKRDVVIEKMSKRIKKTLEKTKFHSSSVVAVSAKPVENNDTNQCQTHIGVQLLLDTLMKEITIPKRSAKGDLILSVDHCFLIKGVGTVMTGTLIQGSVATNDNIEIPSLKTIKKVKNIQMFRKPIEKAIQGDRVGICVTQFDPNLLERGVICSPGFMNFSYAIIASISPINYFKGKYITKSKFHISILHETVIAKSTFFIGSSNISDNATFNFDCDYSYVEEMSELTDDDRRYYVLLQFERSVILYNGALYIASKLDSDINANICRLAFYGNILHTFTDKSYENNDLKKLKVFKLKCKQGTVERIANQYELICKNLFKKETNISPFLGLKVTLSTGEVGVIDASFGQSGKVKIRVPNGICKFDAIAKNKNEKTTTNLNEQIKVSLIFKRFIYESNKRLIQS